MRQVSEVSKSLCRYLVNSSDAVASPRPCLAVLRCHVLARAVSCLCIIRASGNRHHNWWDYNRIIYAACAVKLVLAIYCQVLA